MMFIVSVCSHSSIPSRPYRLTWSVLSNQRFPLFHRQPPPCSICTAARVWYISSETRGTGASRHMVKMLFWIACTDSLFVLSGRQKIDTWYNKNHIKPGTGKTATFTKPKTINLKLHLFIVFLSTQFEIISCKTTRGVAVRTDNTRTELANTDVTRKSVINVEDYWRKFSFCSSIPEFPEHFAVESLSIHRSNRPNLSTTVPSNWLHFSCLHYCHFIRDFYLTL